MDNNEINNRGFIISNLHVNTYSQYEEIKKTMQNKGAILLIHSISVLIFVLRLMYFGFCFSAFTNISKKNEFNFPEAGIKPDRNY